MSKYSEIFNYLRKCPQLSELWSIAATEDAGVRVILPHGASPSVGYNDFIDTLGNYCCDIVPNASVYEDYQINCFEKYDSNDDTSPDINVNVLNLDEVQSICDWIKTQDELGELPEITGEKVVSVECNPCVPQIRYVNHQENIIAYFITVRIRYVNKAKRRRIEHEIED